MGNTWKPGIPNSGPLLTAVMTVRAALSYMVSVKKNLIMLFYVT